MQLKFTLKFEVGEDITLRHLENNRFSVTDKESNVLIVPYRGLVELAKYTAADTLPLVRDEKGFTIIVDTVIPPSINEI